jgi:FkbM family methyltransferase
MASGGNIGPGIDLADIHPNGYARLARVRNGVLLYNRFDQFIGRAIELYGEYCGDRLDLFRQIVQPGDIAVEVGAYIGTTTVALSQAVGSSGAVIAMEAQRLAHQMLCANVALNNLTNVYAPLMAAGDEPGQIVVPILSPMAENNFSALGLRDQVWEGGDAVPVNTVDGFELRHCRLLAIDAEGMEVEVLRGAEATLATCAPIVHVANHRRDKSSALISHLQDRGYQLYWDVTPIWRPANFAGNDKNHFDDTVTVGMLGLPPGDATRVEGRKVASPSDVWSGASPVRTFVPELTRS